MRTGAEQSGSNLGYAGLRKLRLGLLSICAMPILNDFPHSSSKVYVVPIYRENISKRF